MNDDLLLGAYWDDIPINKENAVDYPTLCLRWGMRERQVRSILHELSCYDNGDDFVLIRSGKSKGFYKTDDKSEIAKYRKECLNKGRSIFAPVKKCNRILNSVPEQTELFNGLRTVRELKGLKQKEVCKYMKRFDKNFDVSLLSKMENSVCLPTYTQLSRLAEFYGVERSELIRMGLPSDEVYEAI